MTNMEWIKQLTVEEMAKERVDLFFYPTIVAGREEWLFYFESFGCEGKEIENEEEAVAMGIEWLSANNNEKYKKILEMDIEDLAKLRIREHFCTDLYCPFYWKGSRRENPDWDKVYDSEIEWLLDEHRVYETTKEEVEEDNYEDSDMPF